MKRQHVLAVLLDKTRALAQTAANAENQQLDSARYLLAAITHCLSAVKGRAQRLSDLWADLAGQSGEYADFGIAAPDGRLLAGGDAGGKVRNYGDREWFTACVQSKQLTMGRYHDEHIDGQSVLYIALPALNNRRQVAAVAFTAELRPVILDDFGLAAAIEWQAEAFRNHSGIDCRLQNSGFEPDLPKAQATALFRIFQELLTNVMRHAQASKVTVRLAEADGELILDVQDNGCGIRQDPIDASASYGLLGIRERLYPFNGRVTFEGRAGQGTHIIVRLPLPPHDPAMKPKGRQP